MDLPTEGMNVNQDETKQSKFNQTKTEARSLEVEEEHDEERKEVLEQLRDLLPSSWPRDKMALSSEELLIECKVFLVSLRRLSTLRKFNNYTMLLLEERQRLEELEESSDSDVDDSNPPNVFADSEQQTKNDV